MLMVVLWALRQLLDSPRRHIQNSADSDEITEQNEEDSEDPAVKGPPEVVVQGVGKLNGITDAVMEVGETWRKIIEGSTKAPAESRSVQQRHTRKYQSSNEWQMFVGRVKSGEAYPLLRKFFKYHGGSCNLEQASLHNSIQRLHVRKH